MTHSFPTLRVSDLAGVGKGNAQEVVHENRGAYGQRIAFPRVLVQVGMAHGFVGGADAEQKQENAAGQAGKRASNQQRKGEGQGVKGESLEHGWRAGTTGK